MTIDTEHGINSNALFTFRAFLDRHAVTNFRFGFVLPVALEREFSKQSFLFNTRNEVHGNLSRDQKDMVQYVAGLDVI
jgi:hypothetical protein